jgi:hypothetical protein
MLQRTLFLPLLCIAAVVILVQARPCINWDNPESRDYCSTVLTVTLGDYSRNAVTIDGKEFLNVYFEKSGMFAPKGYPDLPCIFKSVIIPDEWDMKVEIISADYTDIPVPGIAPSKGTIYRNTDPASIS